MQSASTDTAASQKTAFAQLSARATDIDAPPPPYDGNTQTVVAELPDRKSIAAPSSPPANAVCAPAVAQVSATSSPGVAAVIAAPRQPHMAMPNDQMQSGRYLTWAIARRKHAWIAQQVTNGRTVCLTTYLKSTRIGPRQLTQVRAARTGLMVQHGARWLDYSGATISAS